MNGFAVAFRLWWLSAVELRTTNIRASPLSAVRLRTDALHHFKKIGDAEAMIWKWLLVTQNSWRALNTPRLMPDVYDENCSRTELLRAR